MNPVQNIIGSPKSTMKALLLSIFTCVVTVIGGAVSSAVSSAANTFTTTGNITDWKPYAAAGVVGVATFLGSGALQKDIEPVKEAIAGAIPILPGVLAQPIVNNVTDKVMNIGLAYLNQAVTDKLGNVDPNLSGAVSQILTAHQPAPAASAADAMMAELQRGGA